VQGIEFILEEEAICPYLTPGYRNCYFMELADRTALIAAYTRTAEGVQWRL